jgi:hypothetical protein
MPCTVLFHRVFSMCWAVEQSSLAQWSIISSRTRDIIILSSWRHTYIVVRAWLSILNLVYSDILYTCVIHLLIILARNTVTLRKGLPADYPLGKPRPLVGSSSCLHVHVHKTHKWATSSVYVRPTNHMLWVNPMYSKWRLGLVLCSQTAFPSFLQGEAVWYLSSQEFINVE